jgi:indole-3-glycerol phosphate synthase
MSAGVVKTDTILDQILAHKQLEVADRLRQRSILDVQRHAEAVPAPIDFVGGLHRSTVALIAEVKKASPSKGVLIENFDPQALARTYTENGAAAISVLADEKFFQGRLGYLDQVRQVTPVPILCKEFILDPYQVYEAREHQADAVLLIVMALEDAQLADLHALIRELGMAALVEVHNEDELDRALKIGATLIGVNNRDLRTFQEDLSITGRVAQTVPAGVTLVAESAIRTSADVRRMGELGAHAVLVGEGLVKSADIGGQVRAFSSQPKGSPA